MNSNYTYFAVLAFTLAGPLLLSFDKKVAFYKNWKRLFISMIVPAAIYIAWDVYFVSKNVWSFNPEYVIGINIFNLPIEEILFFFVVPYSCIFIYECLIVYFPSIRSGNVGDKILVVMAIMLLIAGICFFSKYYTSWTFIGLSAFLIIIYIRKNYFAEFSANAFLLSYAVVLIPFLVVNGILTKIPVVIYNNEENTGLRIYSIPFEDIFYGMLLFAMNIIIYEKLRLRKDHGTNG